MDFHKNWVAFVPIPIGLIPWRKTFKLFPAHFALATWKKFYVQEELHSFTKQFIHRQNQSWAASQPAQQAAQASPAALCSLQERIWTNGFSCMCCCLWKISFKVLHISTSVCLCEELQEFQQIFTRQNVTVVLRKRS